MFYPEFTISLWLVSAVLVAVFAGVFYAMGAKYIEKNMITFFPEAGQDAITGEELVRLEDEHLRSVLPEEEIKKAA